MTAPFAISRFSLRTRALGAMPALASVLIAACAGGKSPEPVPLPVSAEPAGASVPTSSGVSRPITRWSVGTAEHIDLWLHAFALISRDTAIVPLYRRGYRDSVTAVRSRANVRTALDANRDSLARKLAESPQYLQAQFLAFEFATWEQMRTAAEAFLAGGGSGRGQQRGRNDDAMANRMRGEAFAPVFVTPADREWLRLFVASVQDEHAKYYAAERTRVLAEQSATIAAVDSLWQRVYDTKFARFIANTAQRSGDLTLSLPIGGEGRTGAGRGGQTVAVVTMPGRREDAVEAILVFAHEVTGTLVGGVIRDNTSPAEQRDGTAERYVTVGQTRAGAALVEKIAPELAEPYMRYYLGQAGTRSTATGATLRDEFARRFDVPAPIVTALQKQVDIVLGGI